MAKKKYEVIMVIECEEGGQKHIAQSVCDGLEEPTCVKHIQIETIEDRDNSYVNSINMHMNTYFVEYKDQSGYGVGEEIEASSENQAVKLVQMELITDGGYMSRLIDVQEVTPDNDDNE
jgi:hypothetical protein